MKSPRTGPIELAAPLTDEVVKGLKAGDRVVISGVIYSARDAAHQRFVDLLNTGSTLPFDPAGQIIYYVGPSPAPPGKIIGAAGPTSSYRMDRYTPSLLKLGLKGMIGKGRRSLEVLEAMKKYRAVYFGAVGGAAALIASTVKRARIIAFEELGTEAVRELVVENFPAIVVNDCHGGDLYRDGVKAYKIDA